MHNDKVMAAIAGLDLEPIKTKLMHAASGQGWTRARADATDTEYRRFLYLAHAFPYEAMAPTVDVDTFWHYHILDTVKYAADCDAVFGYFLHHYPNLGIEGDYADDAGQSGVEQRAAERMRQLYETTFGEASIRADAYGSAGKAFCMIRPGTDAAFCMIRPDAVAAAFCMIRPDPLAAALRMTRPGIAPVLPPKATGKNSAVLTAC